MKNDIWFFNEYEIKIDKIQKIYPEIKKITLIDDNEIKSIIFVYENKEKNNKLYCYNTQLELLHNKDFEQYFYDVWMALIDRVQEENGKEYNQFTLKCGSKVEYIISAESEQK